MSERPFVEERQKEQLASRVELFAQDEWERSLNRTGRHWRSLRLRIGSRVLQVSFPVIVAMVALLAYLLLAQSAPRVHGVAVVGHRILLVLDGRIAMSRDSAEVNRQIAALRTSLSPKTATIKGFGTHSGGLDNLRTALEQRLAQSRAYDAVYVLSDFYPTDKPSDCDDAAGLDRVRQLVRSSGVRVYLSTVHMMPPPALVALARESGGGLIGVPRPEDNRAQQAAVCGGN